MNRLDDSRWLIRAISYVSILSILLSVSVFFVSNSLNDENVKYIRGGIEAIKFESLHRDLAIANEIKTQVTGDPALENLLVKILWKQFLKVRGLSTGISELNDVQGIDDWRTNFATSSIEYINNYYRDILNKIERLTYWQNILFALSIITQSINVFLVARLSFLGGDSQTKGL